HILICFMALAICKYMELKSGKSTKKIVRLLMSITDARIRNKLTGEIIPDFANYVPQLSFANLSKSLVS
ncbi:hypothetical protein KKE68_07960, partial [Patescibacteria group bacterium]|nr:hypothetical protein [Patescibacteria group bacterium]